jgi:transcriptional regulator with XRE-family HTH domain
MEARRRLLGDHVRATREAEGHSSQAAFAEVAGISPRSVAKVESGDPSTGRKVFRAIEFALGWPRDSAMDYLEDKGPLPVRASPVLALLEPPVPHEFSADERQKILAMSVDEVLDFARELAQKSQLAALLWLKEATEIKTQAGNGAPVKG